MVKAIQQETFKYGDDVYIGVYPQQAIQKDEGMKNSRYFPMALNGELSDIKLMEGGKYGVILTEVDSSEGQNGAPYQIGADGSKKIGAIYSGIAEYTELSNKDIQEGNFYTGTMITQYMLTEFILPTIQEYEK